MDPSLASQNTFRTPHMSWESDIVDQHGAADRESSFDREIPSRPTSRLGFNRVSIRNTPMLEEEFLEDVPSEGLSESGASGGSSLPGSVWSPRASVDTDHDITAPMSKRDSALQSSPDVIKPCSGHPGLCGEALDGVRLASIDEDLDAEIDSDYSSCDESDDESDTTFLFPPPTPLSARTEASFSPVPPEESDWSIRPKYSCLPSPLSPFHVPPCPFSFRHTPPRHRYRHHGHSRHALLHLKWFWAAREERWMEYKVRQCEAKAYDGLSIFSSVSPGLRLPSECLTTPDPAHTPRPPPSPPMPHLPPLSIHPRRGDLRALRDPYCMHIDRYFVGMPMWTMAKTLWMFDVHMASGEFGVRKQAAGEDASEEDAFEEDQSESESIETSGSHAFSDDSDSTLVESESEPDVPKYAQPAGDAGEACADDRQRKSSVDEDHKGCHDSEALSCTSVKGKCDSDLSASSTSRSAGCKLEHQHSPHSRWATSWYRRWEVLMQLCIENNPAIVADPHVPPTTAPPAKSQRFFIMDDWSDAMADEADEEPQEEETSSAQGSILVVVNDDSSEGPPLRRCRY
ncbi:hypothetical protein LshimejAT787_2001210 [Lyophyllum shimeji]|uniref:Uncharacterized protein n=1 Tax=Lyophyllum shimeji TaxID=47721 RepID=A0A9P3Q0U0_LYOSH|nr:hypothetical protein LshimejAT787_2001210 [Lyophyllum shimeji]